MPRVPSTVPKQREEACKHAFRAGASCTSDTDTPFPECRARRAQAGQPASGPCSADESVTSPSFPRVDVLSFHGLRSPSRSFPTTKRTLASRAAPVFTPPPLSKEQRSSQKLRFDASHRLRSRGTAPTGKHNQRRSAGGPHTEGTASAVRRPRSGFRGADDHPSADWSAPRPSGEPDREKPASTKSVRS